MRVLISGGGTGGHVYPALAVAKELTRSHLNQPEPPHEQQQPQSLADKVAEDSTDNSARHSVIWIGSQGGMEQTLVEREGIDYYGIRTGQLRGINPLAAVKNAGKMLGGVLQTDTLLKQLQPDVCLVTGGYVCAPVVAACRRRGIPVMIYLPDMTPGSAIRWLSHLAKRVAVSFPEAASHFGGLASEGGKAVVTGYPVRAELVQAAQDRTAAREYLAQKLQRPSLSMHPDGTPNDTPSRSASPLPLLLVWGGSQGSRSINQATWSALPQLLAQSHVVHIVGTRDWEMGLPIIEKVKSEDAWESIWSERYHPVAYLHEEMPIALAAADLSVARAGASILGEFPVAGLPSILVPLPLSGVGQLLNARTLEQHGAAVIIQDDDLATELSSTVLRLLSDEEERSAMEKAVRRLAIPDAALRIVKELEYLQVE